MLSAITTTGAYSLTNTPSILSLAKSEQVPSHSDIPESIDKSICDHQSETIPLVNVHEVVSHTPDFSAEAFRPSESAVDKEVEASHPHLTGREGRNSNSTPTAYDIFSDSQRSPNSASCSRAEKDKHEIYLDNLRLLHFGNIADSSVMGDGFLSEGLSFSLVPRNDDDTASWVEIDLQSYGWQV
jgi:hypothetical protein